MLVGASSAGGQSFFQVVRPLVYCDGDLQDISVGDNIVPLILAYGADGSYDFLYHGFDRRGSVWLNLMQKPSPTPSPPDGASIMEVRHTNLSVPQDDETKYCYSAHVFPQDRKYHLLRAEAILNSSHPELVHHMIIYSCVSEVSAQSYADAAAPSTCDTRMQLDCPVFWVMWAVGSGPLQLPDAAGLPMGLRTGGDVNTASHVVLEIHYTNPGRAAAIVDSSGFRLWYTSALRPNDAGVLTLGDVGFSIPPQTTSFEVVNECPGECTRRLTQNLTVFQAGLHMHMAGTAILTQHIASGSELPALGRRSYWDFNQQTAAGLTAVLQPGDRLVTRCNFSTTGRTSATRFGEKTTDEMCFNFLLVYPAPSILLCSALSGFGFKGTAICVTKDASGQKILEGILGGQRSSTSSLMQQMTSGNQLVTFSPAAPYAPYQDPQCQLRALNGASSAAGTTSAAPARPGLACALFLAALLPPLAAALR